MGFEVYGLGFRTQGLAFGLGLKVEGPGFRAEGFSNPLSPHL